MSIQHINIELIRQDGGTQARAAMDAVAIEEYALAMAEGGSFPPVVVFQEGDVYWLGDGFHRAAAHFKAFGYAPIAADVREGGLREARLFAIGANMDHGIRRTNADKRMAVNMLLQDPEWSVWSDRQIAKHCNVSQPFVSGLRAPKLATLPPTQGDNVITTGSNNHISKQEQTALEPKVSTVDTSEVVTVTTPKPATKHEVDDRDARITELERMLAAKDEEVEDLRERLTDTGALLKSAQEDLESRDRILDSEDLLAAYRKEVKANMELARVTQSRNNGLMTENADLAGRLKSALRKIERLEKKEMVHVIEEVAS